MAFWRSLYYHLLLLQLSRYYHNYFLFNDYGMAVLGLNDDHMELGIT